MLPGSILNYFRADRMLAILPLSVTTRHGRFPERSSCVRNLIAPLFVRYRSQSYSLGDTAMVGLSMVKRR